jgi:hypothetical protein
MSGGTLIALAADVIVLGVYHDYALTAQEARAFSIAGHCLAFAHGREKHRRRILGERVVTGNGIGYL